MESRTPVQKPQDQYWILMKQLKANMVSKQSRKNHTPGWFGITNSFVDSELKELPPYCFVVYICLLRHMDRNKHTCFPSQSKIAEKTGINKRTVVRSIKKLRELGFISIEKYQKSEWLSNVYKLHRGIPEYQSVTNNAPPSANKYSQMVLESHANKNEYNKNNLSRHTPRDKDDRQTMLEEQLAILANKMKFPL